MQLIIFFAHYAILMRHNLTKMAKDVKKGCYLKYPLQYTPMMKLLTICTVGNNINDLKFKV